MRLYERHEMKDIKLFSFWPLLVIIALLAAWTFQIAPQNLKLIPYKLLIVCIGAYFAHRLHLRFFADRHQNNDLAAAIIYAATVIAMALAL